MSEITRVVLDIELPDDWDGWELTDWNWETLVNTDDSHDEPEDMNGGSNSNIGRVGVNVVSISTGLI